MNNPSNPKRKAATILSLGVLCASIFSAGIAGATEPAPTLPTTPTTVTSSLSDENSGSGSSPVESETLTIDEDDFAEWEPTQEEIAEFNAEVAKLSEAFTTAGIAFTLETDESGLQYLEWDEADDEQAWEILDEVFADTLIADDADFDWQPTAEDIAEINAEIAKEVQALEAAGISTIMETDEFGISLPTWDEGDNEAAMAVFDELYGPTEGFGNIDFNDADFNDADWKPTAEDIVEINELIKSEIKALTDAGVSFTLETDEFGFEFPMWDQSDDDAAWDALGTLWDDEFELLDGDAAGE